MYFVCMRVGSSYRPEEWGDSKLELSHYENGDRPSKYLDSPPSPTEEPRRERISECELNSFRGRYLCGHCGVVGTFLRHSKRGDGKPKISDCVEDHTSPKHSNYPMTILQIQKRTHTQLTAEFSSHMKTTFF